MYHFKNYWNFDLECTQGNHKIAFWARNFTGTFEKQDPGLQNPYLFSDQASNKLNSSLLWLEGQQKNFLKFIYNLQIINSFFLIHLELKQQIYSCTPVVPSKTRPDSRPRWAKSIPFFRPKRGGTYQYGLYERVQPPQGGTEVDPMSFWNPYALQNKPQDNWFLRPWS